MAVTVLLAIDNLLPDSGLYLLIHAGIRKSHQQTVGPRLVHKSEFDYHSLVVVRIVESAHMLHLFAVYSSGREILHGRIYPIIIIRIILKRVYLIFEAAAQCLTDIYI